MSEQEWGVMCPDDSVWPDITEHKWQAQEWLSTAAADCGCERDGHRLAVREIPDWEVAR